MLVCHAFTLFTSNVNKLVSLFLLGLNYVVETCYFFDAS